MLVKRYVRVDGILCPVTLSDESKALQAAYAAGGAVIGIWKAGETDNPGISRCLYLVTDPSAADEKLLEKAARRRLGLPLQIARTSRLVIREFCGSDPLEIEESSPDNIFSDRKKRLSYIQNQYQFYECGLWCLIERETKEIVGKAGVTDGELGYHIYRSYRKMGYAFEACQAILAYAKTELELTKVFLRVKSDNLPSDSLARRLGFRLQKDPARTGEGSGDDFLYYEKVL